jgi:hypothetical protein
LDFAKAEILEVKLRLNAFASRSDLLIRRFFVCDQQTTPPGAAAISQSF